MRPQWAALLSALLLCVPVALVHASVPAPENIRVRCGDQRPVVFWDYSSQQPTNFTILLPERGQSFSTRDHELDLSGVVWDSSKHVFDYHYVTVRAEQGLNQSEPRRSQSFSYNRYKTVDVLCNLKFPPVTLTGNGAEATLSFENPLHFYKELRTIKDAAEILLEIIVENGVQDKHCGREPVCELFVNLPEDAEPCVNLKGAISYGAYGAEQIVVQGIGPICATVTTDVIWTVAISVLVFIIIVILLLVFVVCKYRAYEISTPQILISWKDSPTDAKQAVNPTSHRPFTLQQETVYSSVQITGTRSKTIEDPESPSPQSHQVQDDEGQVLIPPSDLYEDQYESAESTKTESLSLHSSTSEIEVSNYERRTELVEMDVSGDMVKGYTS